MLTFFSTINATDVKQLFLQMPSETLKSVNRLEIISEDDSQNGYLKLKLSNEFSGEFKVLAEKKDETTVGFTIYSCAESDVKIWSVKKGIWKEITSSAVPKLGAKDVVEMLKTSPATVEKLNTETSIPYFYNFYKQTSGMKLVMRKQTGCEVAGIVYDYEFNGKKFNKK